MTDYIFAQHTLTLKVTWQAFTCPKGYIILKKKKTRKMLEVAAEELGYCFS